MERRKHPRDDKNIKVNFLIEEKTIKCEMQNLSESGALFKIESAEKDKISVNDIGKEVTIEIKNSKKKITQGRIIRVVEENDIKYFAVFFLKQ